MNSITHTTIVTPTMFVSKSMSQGELNYLGTPNDLYWDGFMAYSEGQGIEDMPTEYHVKGWWAASSAEAETEAYVEDQLDREYWSRGSW